MSQSKDQLLDSGVPSESSCHDNLLEFVATFFTAVAYPLSRYSSKCIIPKETLELGSLGPSVYKASVIDTQSFISMRSNHITSRGTCMSIGLRK